MNRETIFSGYIKEVGSSYNQNEQNIYFRLINFNNLYCFAEEIATGAIFPIGDYENHQGTREYSYASNVRYYIPFPLEPSDKIFEFKISEVRLRYSDIGLPTIDEINDYLKNAKNSWNIRRNITRMETGNTYICGLKTIKEHIAKLQEGHQVIDFEQENISPKYSSYTPKINLNSVENFGYDLSTQDNLCNLIGREEEIKRIVKTLGIKEKSAILIGESGSGKTAIVEGLALDIKTNSNEWLEGKTIFYLETYSLEADTKFRGTFEDKIKKVIDFCQKHEEKIILFIDEIHTLYGLGRTDERAIDAMNILKPYISSGQIIIIGATTKIEYQKYMANDPAFLRRFEVIEISSPDLEMNINIIISYIKELEEIHSIKLELEQQERHAIAEYITTLADYESQRTSRIDITTSKSIIKDAFAEAIYNKGTSVKVEDICFAIISCNKLSPSFRKVKAEELKLKLQNMKLEVEEKPNIRTKTMN